MVIRHSRESVIKKITDYYNSKALNVSTLKQLFNPKWVRLKQLGKLEEDNDKRHFRIGGALDCLLTSPETFDIEYAIMRSDRPGGMMGKFVDKLPLGLKPSSNTDEYEEAYEEAGFKIPIDKVIEKLWDKSGKAYKYYMKRNRDKDKIILSKDEYNEVKHAKQYLLNNPYTRELFMSPKSHIKIYTQVPIYFTYRNEECKGLIDLLYIDEENKIIYLYDLKTIGLSISAFYPNFLKLGYYLQGAFYEIGLKKVLSGELGAYAVDFPSHLYKDYEVKHMQFIVTEKKIKHSNPARIYAMTDLDYEVGVYGGTSKSGKEYMGVNELVDLYRWHKSTGKWDYPKEMYDNNGVYILDMFSESKKSKQADDGRNDETND